MLICLISLIVQQAYDRKVMMAVADIAIASCGTIQILNHMFTISVFLQLKLSLL